ncbi:hypothetical protein GF345_06755 [Candidatus Woesearchaeota archaeon]|nr:hypothetical protein [Candidatus Woesearchaeota archaeon]
MNKALRDLFLTLLNQRCFGRKHTPEKKLIRSKTRWLDNAETKEFYRQYKQAVNESLIVRMKKRTKKGSDWHISLNTRMKKEIMRSLEW